MRADEGFKAETQTSATKTPLAIRDTPQSISVVTQESLEARQVQELGQGAVVGRRGGAGGARRRCVGAGGRRSGAAAGDPGRRDRRRERSGTANIYAENFSDFPTVEPAQSYTGVFEQPSTGGYAQLHLRPLERLGLLMGGRFDSTETTAANRFAGTKSEREDDAFTGRAGAVFDVSRNVSVYGLYAQSFQPVLFSTSADGELLSPEEGEIYEAGVKTEWLGGRLGANAAVFRIERENVPIPDPNNMPGDSFSISGGSLRSEGVELEINGEPLPGWNLSFAGTLLDSRFIERADPRTFGNSEAGVADWQVGFFASYELQSGPLEGLGLGAGLFAIGDRAVSATDPGALDGYERVDLYAFYNGFDPINLRLQVRNVFDERYVEGSDRIGGFNQFGSPRAVLVTMRARW